MAALTTAVLLVAVTLAAAQTGNISTGTSSMLPGSMSNYTTTPTTASPGTITTPTNFQRFNLTTVDPLAVCNDGSPGFYYFRPGTGAGANKWVIRMEGGGWCSDQQTCTLRYSASPSLMTSNTIYYPNILPGASVAGILAGDPRANPFWYTWNHVSVGYCSSDSYLGDAGTGDTAEVGLFQFRGQRVVNATIRSLLAAQQLDAATSILVVGVSAGAIGALNLADSIYSLIEPTSTLLTTFKAVIDAGWFTDLPSYSIAPSAFTFRTTAIGLLENFKATFNAGCMAANGNQSWACFFAQYAWPYVKTPLIFHDANLGYDSAASQNNEETFRADLTTVFNTPANAIVPVSNSTRASPPTSSVATQSIGPSGPSVQSSGPGSTLPTLSNSAKPPAGAPKGIYAPGLQNLPPAFLPSNLPPGKMSPPGAPPPSGPSQVTNATGLPGVRAPIGANVLPSVFAPACGLHDITDNDLFAVSHVGTTAFTTVLNQWFTTGQAALPLIDGIVGLGNNQYCLTALPVSG